MEVLRASVIAVTKPAGKLIDGLPARLDGQLDTITSRPRALTGAQLRAACQQLRVRIPKSGRFI